MQIGQQSRAIRRLTLRVGVACLLLVSSLVCSARPNDSYTFALKDIQTGDSLDLASLAEDRPVVVMIWSPHCPHCQRHMPYFAGLYNKVDLNSVSVVTIAVDCSSDDALDYVTRKKLSFPVLLAKSGKVSDGFYKQGWPTTFVFSPGGRYAGSIDSSGPPYINDVLALVDKAQQ
jgi:thiol-disulfide isomerase/thioredoxin